MEHSQETEEIKIFHSPYIPRLLHKVGFERKPNTKTECHQEV